MSLRLIAGLALGATLLIAAPASAVTGVAVGEQVPTASGLVEGVVLDGGVRAWLGLPFAAPPVGDLRWRAPQPVAPWAGVLHADRKAPECIQVLRAHNLNHYFGEEATSEDCLYLNVWAPAKRADKALPVIVWIHGGGFTIGSSGMAIYDGARLAADGAIVVSMNYRLGALGFMAHPELAQESAAHASGNYGLMDQIAALKWVQANIGKFGGDPGNVTLAGQSAGAMSVAWLQLSPLAQGLFHKGAAMSGGPAGLLPLQDRATAEASGLALQKALKATSIVQLRTLPADRILAQQADCQLGCTGAIRMSPSLDGAVLPADPADLLAAGKGNAMPVLMGFTRDESASPLKSASTVAEYQAAARSAYGPAAERLLALYPAKTDADVADAANALARETGMEQIMRRWAKALSTAKLGPVYMFEFARKHPYAPAVQLLDQDPARIGAYHTSDVPYWLKTQWALNSVRHTRDWTPEDEALADTMSGALLAFARTGSPGLNWPVWSPGKEQLMQFGKGPRLSPLVLPMNGVRLDFAAGLPAPASASVLPSTGRPRD